MKVINQNLRPIRHPYFSAYTELQNLCLRILRHESIKYGQEKDKVYGILFDGAWLWEEYLAILLKDKFNHYLKNSGKKFYLFQRNSNNIQQIIPDYISIDRTVVADAKYIPLDKNDTYGEKSERATAIYYKTITYMYRFNTTIGYLLYPNPNYNKKNVLIINGESGGELIKLGLHIPSGRDNFKSFVNAINDAEDFFLKEMKV